MPHAASPTALYIHPDAYRLPEQRLMGRQMAGNSFLRAFLPRHQERHGDPLPILVETKGHADDFLRWAVENGCRPEAQVIGRDRLQTLGEVGCLHLPGPGLGEEAWRRSFYGADRWSLTGITHTTCSDRVMEALTDFLTAPVQPWDALICTSSAVKGHVEQQLTAAADHLRHRLGAQRIVLPQLPVIPLGVICADFEQGPSARAEVRAALGLGPQDVAVLFMGRLSFHAKAHPVPMYLALEAAQATLAREGGGQQLVLLEYGRHGLESVAEAYRQAQRVCCPSVRCLHLDGHQEALRLQALAGADLFCSLSDNIQEAFGLTPVEAMAAGLPLVVSDWNGYRDTVRDGVDGFRIPTLTPRPGLGQDLALRYGLGLNSYDQYVGSTAAVTAVEIDAVAKALLELARHPGRRRRMGEAARLRACQHYDWPVVLERYEQLWGELAAMRRVATRPASLAHPWPARLEPFTAFQGYPSSWLDETSSLQAAFPAQEGLQRLEQLLSLSMAGYTAAVIPTRDEQRRVLELLEQRNHSANELSQQIHGDNPRRWVLLRGLAWMLKMGLIAPGDSLHVRNNNQSE